MLNTFRVAFKSVLPACKFSSKVLKAFLFRPLSSPSATAAAGCNNRKS